MSTLLFAALLSALQADAAPWNRDVAATRESAVREAKPCVLLINSDAGAL